MTSKEFVATVDRTPMTVRQFEVLMIRCKTRYFIKNEYTYPTSGQHIELKEIIRYTCASEKIAVGKCRLLHNNQEYYYICTVFDDSYFIVDYQGEFISFDDLYFNHPIIGWFSV